MDMPLDRRAELLEKIVEALLESGAADLSLRPLAEQVGTSARLLIYHFESKDLLVARAIEQVHADIAASLSVRVARDQPESLRALLAMFWDWATAPANQRHFRLLLEIDGLTLYQRIRFSEEFRRANSMFWDQLIDQAAARLPRTGDRPTARVTLIFCALTGLLQEFLANGDLDKTTAAFATLIDLVAPAEAAPVPVQGSAS
jgi:AcrR family transcriptional regulator